MKQFNEQDRIEVENLTNGIISIEIPDILLKVEWAKKGTKRKIEFGKLQQALYDSGTEYMFKNGMLYIEDLDAKKALELEPFEAEVPENIIVLNDGQRKRLLTTAPIEELKKTLKELNKEQVNELIVYAINNEITDINRCEILKEFSGKDVIRAIQLNRQDKEKDNIKKNK